MSIRNQLTSDKMDMLKEAGNIGAGHAVSALSQLLERPVNMSIAKVNVKDISELSQVLGDEEKYIAAMIIEVYGDLNAMLLLALEEESARELVKLILKQQDMNPIKGEFSEFDYSVLCETGNILAGSYLNALGTLANLELTPSVPQAAIDMAGAILSFAATEFAQDDNAMMFIETKFNDDEELLNGTYILALDKKSLECIINSLGNLL